VDKQTKTIDPNPVYRFFTHPFMRSLGKLAAYIFVGWNALMLAVFGPLVALVIVAAAVSGDEPAVSYLDGLTPVVGDTYSDNQLLAVSIQGEIIGETDDPAAAFGGVTDGYKIKRLLQEAAGRSEIRGVVLEINSPGGTIYGSRAIADGVAYYREQTKQPVYAHIQGAGASGAYWAAVATDRVLADYGSDVGSIGVVMGPFKYYDRPMSETGSLFEGGVVTQNGIQTVTLTAGTSKDVGNPYRRLTTQELSQLQQSLNNEYDQFVKYVAERRHISEGDVRGRIGAMIYDNKTAQDLKLIDGSASRDDAYAQLAKAAKLEEGDYTVMRQVDPAGFVASLLGVLHLGPAPVVKTPYDTCRLAQAKLAYYGEVAALCR
jgi:protease IV